MLRKNLYRTLFNLGKKFDKNPRYKAMIFTSEARFRRIQSDDTGDRHSSVEMKTNLDISMKYYVDKVCSPGFFYKPSISLADVVRDGFRNPPPVELSAMERNQLAFMAIRFLFNCKKLGDKMSSLCPVNSPNVIISNNEANAVVNIELCEQDKQTQKLLFNPDNNKPLLTIQPTPTAGSLLVSHPLHLQYPFNNTVILLTEVENNYSSGFILNKSSLVFKELLRPQDIELHGSYLSPFYDQPCFLGGFGLSAGAHQCVILHQIDALAQYSKRIDLCDSTSLQATFNWVVHLQNAAAAAATEQVSSVELEGEGLSVEESKSAGQATPALPTTNPGTNSQNFLYVSYDFKSIGNELKKGAIDIKDLKLVHGSVHWKGKKLQSKIAENEYFVVQPTAHELASQLSTRMNAAADINADINADLTASDVEYGKVVSQEQIDALISDGNRLIANLVMSHPSEHNSDSDELNVNENNRWLEIEYWEARAYSWCKALYFMGGEYQDMARMHMLPDKYAKSEKRETFLNSCRNLNEYGTKLYDTTDSSDPDGSESDWIVASGRNGDEVQYKMKIEFIHDEADDDDYDYDYDDDDDETDDDETDDDDDDDDDDETDDDDDDDDEDETDDDDDDDDDDDRRR